MPPEISPRTPVRDLANESVRAPLPGSDVDLLRISRLSEDRPGAGDLAPYLPQFTHTESVRLASDIVQGAALTFRDRLSISLLRLSELPAPSSGALALSQIAAVFLAVEKVYAAQAIPLQEYREALLRCGAKTTPDSMIEEAFRAYRFGDADSPYDESDYPRAFGRLLKPPALRYNKAGIFEGKDVIPQLSHLTIVDRTSGAVQIQCIDIDHARKGLGDQALPLICGIAADRAYFQSLPTRRDLVVYDRPGADGTRIWNSSTWSDDAWARSLG